MDVNQRQVESDLIWNIKYLALPRPLQQKSLSFSWSISIIYFLWLRHGGVTEISLRQTGIGGRASRVGGRGGTVGQGVRGEREWGYLFMVYFSIMLSPGKYIVEVVCLINVICSPCHPPCFMTSPSHPPVMRDFSSSTTQNFTAKNSHRTVNTGPLHPPPSQWTSQARAKSIDLCPHYLRHLLTLTIIQ